MKLIILGLLLAVALSACCGRENCDCPDRVLTKHGKGAHKLHGVIGKGKGGAIAIVKGPVVAPAPAPTPVAEAPADAGADGGADASATDAPAVPTDASGNAPDAGSPDAAQAA